MTSIDLGFRGWELTGELPDPWYHWRRHAENPHFVYFVYNDDVDAVKIGQAADPFKRLAELQCGNPRELKVGCLMLATPVTERGLHYKWRAQRFLGEWFTGRDRILEKARDWRARQIQASLDGATVEEVHALTREMVVR